MRVLIGIGDREIVEGLSPAFARDAVSTVELATVTEPDAFALVDTGRVTAVVLVPDLGREDRDDVRGCWWLARAAELARIPVVLLSSAEVFDGNDRRPRSEFDRPAPVSAAGRLADATEQLVRWTTGRVVVVRAGPLDRGSRSVAALLHLPGGVLGGPDALVTPFAVDLLGPRLRALAAGRRYGTWHLVAESVTLGSLAERHGLAPPRAGRTPVPPPLAAELARMGAETALPPAPPPFVPPPSVLPPSVLPPDDRTRR